MTRLRLTPWLLPALIACGGDDPSPSAPDAGPDPDGQGEVTPSPPDATDPADLPAPAPDTEPTPDAGDDAGTDTGPPPVPTPCTTPTLLESPPAPLTRGDITLRPGRDGGWSLTWADTGRTLEAPPLCVDGQPALFAWSGRPAHEYGFGSFRFDWDDPTGVTPVPVTGSFFWDEGREARTLVAATADGGTVRLTFAFAGDDLDLSVQTFDADNNPSTDSAAGFTMACGPDSAYFGLGTQVTSMNLRGRSYPLWTQEQGIGKPEGGGVFGFNNVPEAAYAPMGVLHASEGWSAVVLSDGLTEVDLCNQSADRLVTRGVARTGWRLLVRPTPADRMEAVTALVGRPTPPAPWTFGVWVSAVGGEARVRQVAGQVRADDIPVSAIWTEDWIGGSLTQNGFRLSYDWAWSRSQYPNLPDIIRDLHAEGFAFLGYFNTFVPNTVPHFAEGDARGLLVKDAFTGETWLTSDPAFRRSALVDLTHPEARDWMAGFMRIASQDLGLDGWMADFTEWMPLEALLEGGDDPWFYHNVWPLDFHRLIRSVMEEVHPADGPDAGQWTFFARSGWASVNGGMAGTAPVLWGGDQNTDWGYDDGLPSVVPIAAHAGMSGVALFGSDIAGYSSFLGAPTSTKELFLRWTALGAFHPVMRTHHGSSKCDNWSLERDDETLAHFRRYAWYHVWLYDYLAAATDEAVQRGMPVTRHAYLMEPDRPSMWGADVYAHFLGPDLLVTPVVDEGRVRQRVKLPEAGWWPLLGGPAVAPDACSPGIEDACEIIAEVPVTEIAVHVRPGTALVASTDLAGPLYPQPVIRDAATVSVALFPDTAGAASGGWARTVQVEVAGWTTEAAAWAEATVGGSALQACPARPCWEDGVLTVEVGASPVAVAWQGGSATLAAAGGGGPQVVRLGHNPWAEGSPERQPDLSAPGVSWCDQVPEAP
jgi:alpha-glucosidase (family GH31 glycosyl hydrolase)